MHSKSNNFVDVKDQCIGRDNHFSQICLIESRERVLTSNFRLSFLGAITIENLKEILYVP